MDKISEFLVALGKLAGLDCWGVIAGSGSGSRVTLHLGKRIKRERPLMNPRLPELVRSHTGEYGLFIENCAWRLDGDSTLCTSKTPNENDGPMVAGLRSLEGQRIVATLAVSGIQDVVLEFSK